MKFKGPWELYDMEADRTERHDVIRENTAIAKELIKKWNDWAERAHVDPWVGLVRTEHGAEHLPPKEQKKAD